MRKSKYNDLIQGVIDSNGNDCLANGSDCKRCPISKECVGSSAQHLAAALRYKAEKEQK